MSIKGFFTDMFIEKRKKTKDRDIFSELLNTPEIEGFHVFAARSHIDYGYGKYPLDNKYGALEYIGSTTNEVLVEELYVLNGDHYRSFLVVMKGKLLELNPILETYTETIKKEKIVGYRLG